MHRIGYVLHVSSSRNLIIRAESLPRIGDKVMDKHLKLVGTVFDVFGPTSSPYISVKPKTGQPHHLVNHVLYSVPSPKMKIRRKRR